MYRGDFAFFVDVADLLGEYYNNKQLGQLLHINDADIKRKLGYLEKLGLIVTQITMHESSVRNSVKTKHTKILLTEEGFALYNHIKDKIK